MSKNWQQDILDFHKKAGQIPYPYIPKFPSNEIIELRKRLIAEEIGELFEAIDNKDIVKFADGIVDSIVVLIGSAIAYGINLNPIWDEIHNTNMNKFIDGVILDSGGKVQKPKNWQPPNIKACLLAQSMTYRIHERYGLNNE